MLALDYRGYGKSEGSPNEAGVIADGRAARAWLADKARLQAKDLVLWGESLGCGVAIELAADGARALILENAFTSLPDVAAYHYPWAPVRILMRNRLRSIDKIGQFKGPILQAHGDADTIIPYEIGRRLFEAASEPKEFITIPGGDHNDPRTPQFWQAADQFLQDFPHSVHAMHLVTVRFAHPASPSTAYCLLLHFNILNKSVRESVHSGASLASPAGSTTYLSIAARIAAFFESTIHSDV